MFFGGRFKKEPSNNENSVSFNNNATSNKLKEDLLSLVNSPAISPDKNTMPPSMVNQNFHLNSGSPFAQMQNVATNEKPKKRPYSKPCPKSRKKKILDSSFNDEEKNLDSDLLGLVGAINADKNLDSESSNESIEFNDTIYLVDNNPISPQENLFNDVNSLKEKAAPASAFLNSSLKSFVSTDGAKHQTFAVEKKKGVEVKSRVPVFKEIMPTSFSKNSSPSTSSSILSNLLTTESSNETVTVSPTGAKKKKSEVLEDIAPKAGTPDQSSISNNSSGACQSNKTLNYQSIYAAMGLDEDLCDTEQASSKVSNSVSKETIEITSSPEKFDNLSEVKIKTEKVSSPNAYSDKKTDDARNENLTLDGYHVSWTFEAETPCDDGEEEDVPLMLLKNKPADVINPQIKSASIDLSHKVTSISDKTSTVTGNKIDNFPPSLFIKKELIEDEIVSASQAVSANTQISNSNDKIKTSTNSLPVKIKSEPIDTEYFSENYTKTNISTSLELPNNQLSACSSTGLSEKTPAKKQKKSSASKSSTDNSKNYILARLRLDLNPSSLSLNSANTNISSKTITENASSANSSLSELLDSAKPVTKKPVSKKKRVVKKKATNVIDGLENSLAEYSELPQTSQTPDSGNLLTESASNSNIFNINDRSASIAKIDDTIETVIKNSELLEIPRTPDRGNLLTDFTSNSNNFNANDRSAAIAKIDDTIESVIRNSLISEKQIKGKTKATSKKSVPESISLSTFNSEILANDKTFETQEKNATDSETDTALETDTAPETDIQINPDDTEKRKRESIEKDMNIDENVPITLLIKRQKTDTDSNPAGSFLCTNITSKSSTVESGSVYNDAQGLDIDECEEMSFLSGKKDLDSNILSSEIPSIPQNTKKKKRTGKKKSKKKSKLYQQVNVNPLSAVAGNEAVSTDFSSTPIKESDSSAYTALEEAFGEKNKVRTGKNSSFYSESATVDGFTDMSSQENLYTAISSFDAQSEESLSLSSTSFQTSVSGDVNSRSETNNLNSLSVPSKKKKRCRRSFGWYKKKKTRKEKERSRKRKKSADKVEIQNPVLDASRDLLQNPVLDVSRDLFQNTVLDASTDPLLFTGKTPIVVIKNLNSELHNIGNNNYMKAIHNIAEIQNAENNRAKISSEILEKLPVTSSSKVQKKKGNKSRKKTKPRISLKNNYIPDEDEDTLEALPVSESDKISANDSIETICLQNESSNTSKEISKNTNSLEEITNESNISSSQKKDLTKGLISESDEVAIAECKDSSVNSTVNTNRRGFFASLNVEAFEKQIEELEAIIGSQSNRDNLSQNIPSSNLNAAEIQNTDESITLIKDTNRNLPGSSKNTDSVLNSITSFQACNTIPVKKEINDNNARNSVDQIDENTSHLNPFRAALSGQESIANAVRREAIFPLMSMKKEKHVESQSLHKNTASNYIENCASTSNRIGNQTDRLTSVESANLTNSIPNPEYGTSLNNSHTSNVDNIGLAIKKEVTRNVKSVSNNTPSFSDQNDLIQQVHASSSKQSSTNLYDTSSRRDFRRYLPDARPDPIPESQKKSLDLLHDDEVQIIPKENIAKDIPLIELDDDDDLCNSEHRIQDKISDYDAITSISSKFIELSKQIKTEKDDPKANSVLPEVSNEVIQTSNSTKQISSFSFSKSDQIQDMVDPSKVRTVVSDSNFACTENYVSEDPIKRETSNPFIVRDKYINEYFKHPFPPSQACYKKRRNRSKIYERIDSTAWNLSLDEVESRLKHSENTLPQFGKKLGDIVKLEKYPVSKNEVECYHRILGVAPSHKLLSKCYLTPNQKFLTGFNSLLNRFDQSEMGTKSATHLSINDLLQGITESKMMSNNFDGMKIAFDRDCPSAETRDSFDSSVSHSTDKYVNAIPDKNIEQSSSTTLKQNELNSTPENISLISQNSSLCIGNSEDVSNNAITNNIDTSSNAPAGYDASSVIKSNEVSNLSYLQNNILANLNLPSKEVVNSILNSAGTSPSTTTEASCTTPKCVTESTNTTTVNTIVNNESSLPPSYSTLESRVSSEVNTNVSKTVTNTNKIFDIINLPVVELRKILDTAKTLPPTSNDNNTLQSDKVSSTLLHANNANSDSLQSDTVNHDSIWKNTKTFEYNHNNKETFEYNHISTPVTNADSVQDSEVPEMKDGFSESNEDAGEQTRNENSDDEYVDNEPMHYNSDNERSDSSSHENEEESEEPPIPQYKSKWEKIMERKSQELKQKEKINELYLKDCVPVSSRLKPQSKRNSVYSKVSEVVDKKSEQPKEKESSKVQKNKSDGKKLKQVESKKKTGTEGEKVDESKKKKGTEGEKINESKKKKGTEGEKINESNKKTGTEGVKVNKSQKTSKKVEKQNSKTNDPTAAKKESPKKNKSKKPDEAPNLFEVPDKLVKTSPVKKPATSVKSNEKAKFYGNRVTNRGSFLTEATPAKDLIKIPKKKVPEITKKSANVRSEEFHSMVKSPDINIDLRRISSGRNFNRTIDNRKNSEEYKSPLSNPSPSFTPHFIRTKRMRDRQNAYLNSRSPFAGKNVPQNKKPLLPEPYSKPSPYLNDETVQIRSPLLNTPPTYHQENFMASPSTHHQENFMASPTHHQENFMGAMQNRNPLLNTPSTHQENFIGHKIPVLCSPLSSSPDPLLNTPSNPHPENSIGHKIPVLCSSSSQGPSDSTQSAPSTEILQKIMSIFNKNEAEDNMLSNPESIDASWNNNPYNSPYIDAESSIPQNTNLQPNLSFDSLAPISNPFRNISQVDSLNLQRTAVGSQHNINLPFNSVAPINTSLDPRRASLGLQSNMLSNSAMPGSPAITETLDPRRAALGVQPRIPVGTSSANSLDPRRTAQPNMPAVSLMSTNLINIPLSENLDPRKAAFAVHQTSSSGKKHPESPFNTGSQILNSPPHMVSTPQQPPRKATCLVPSHLKTVVGHETIETHNVRLLMLEWSVDWLIQQQKLHDPPPISNALKKVSSSYDSFEDYYNTYFPLMLLETWHRIYVSWTHLNQTAPFLCQINSYSVKNHYVSVECQTLFSTDNRRKGIFPDEGSILMVKYSTKSNEYTIKILGYVTNVKTRRYNSVTDSKICSSLTHTQHIQANQDSLQILTLTFMGAYNSEDIDKRQPVRIHVLCTVKHNLKQNDAMLYINKSPLQRSILNPVADGLLTFSLTPRNSPEEKVNECVRDITKGILSPHPLPLLTVVRAKPESDRLNIIPLLIQKMKTAYKTKVLLCVRTVRALGDIAANICLQQSLKLVIINKRCDTNLQFQKFLLDELVACEAKKMEEGAIGDKKLSSEACIKIKKQIIKDCDVILSLIRNSHDDFLDQTFHETESIAQMCCIVDEANLCTEPETLIPILHGISKLILIGDPDYTAKVLSKTASAYDFNQSFFQRAYDLDLLTE